MAAQKSGSKKLLKAVDALLEEFAVLPFDVPATPSMVRSVPSWRLWNAALGFDAIDVIADNGYFSGLDLIACRDGR